MIEQVDPRKIRVWCPTMFSGTLTQLDQVYKALTIIVIITVMSPNKNFVKLIQLNESAPENIVRHQTRVFWMKLLKSHKRHL